MPRRAANHISKEKYMTTPKKPGDTGEAAVTVDTSSWEFSDGTEVEPGDRPEVVELARLLPRVALASVINSDRSGDQDRERLRGLVPVNTYFLLVLNLLDLRSQFARRYSRVARRPLNRRTIDLLTFSSDYRASDEAEPARGDQS
jgi:hypothetical protein